MLGLLLGSCVFQTRLAVRPAPGWWASHGLGSPSTPPAPSVARWRAVGKWGSGATGMANHSYNKMDFVKAAFRECEWLLLEKNQEFTSMLTQAQTPKELREVIDFGDKFLRRSTSRAKTRQHN